MLLRFLDRPAFTCVVLGARPSDIVRLVVAPGLRTLALGLLLGIACALAVTRFIQSLLFETGPLDPAAWLGTLLVPVLTGAAACCFPATQASRVDPMAALRME